MSAGSFTRSIYQAQYAADAFHPIRVQPETLLLSLDVNGTATQNIPPAGAVVTNPISALVSAGPRNLGLKAAKVRLRWTGSVPANYDPNGILTVPVLNFQLRTVASGTTGTYLENPVEVIGRTPESIR